MDEHSVLVGRSAEKGAIAALLNRGSDGGACLVLRGMPGVGKSALLAWAAAEAGEDFQVLRAVGTVSEFGLPYAALHQVLRSVFDKVNQLSPHHREALEVAFGRKVDAKPDVYAISMAALELLAEAAVERPVLVLADDAQWMDLASQQALAFISRRIASDRIVLLATHRDSEPGPLLDFDIPAAIVGPLDPDSAGRILDEAAAELDPRQRSRLLAVAAGNPLALLELPRAATGVISSDGEIPITTRLESSFLARIGQFEATDQVALDVAAVNDSDSVGEVVAATEFLVGREAGRSLDAAVEAGLIRVDGLTVQFRHPLVRSAILRRLSLDGRRRCHSALAEVLQARPERAVWHRSAAALKPDGEIAAELEETADRAIERGAPANAVRALDRAAQLSVESCSRRRRCFRAAVLAYTVGMSDSGERLRAEYHNLVQDDHDALRHEWLDELSGTNRGGEQRIAVLLDMAARATEIGDRELSMDLLRAAALRCWNLFPGRPVGKQAVASAQELAAGDVVALAEVLAYAAPFDSSEKVRELIAQVPLAARDAAVSYRLAHASACAGLFDVSEGLLTAAADALRAEGRLQTLGRSSALLAWSALRRGHWAAAVTAAEEGARLSAETRQPFWEAAALVAHALVAASRGDLDAAEDLVAQTERMDSHQFATIGAIVLVARAAISSGRGHHDVAYRQLCHLHDPSHPAYHPAHALWSLASLAEAAVQCDEVEGARSVLAMLRPEVRDTNSATGRMNLVIARALLAPEDQAESSLRVALDVDMLTWPFEHYRLQFAFGRLLRRKRQVRESRDYLRRARDGFDGLGARVFADRAREELRAAGERSESAVPGIWDALSPQEAQIATMVAQGLSNREIGRQLFLSHRTVGSHLYRIFPKLGVTSRGELQHLAGERDSAR